MPVKPMEMPAVNGENGGKQARHRDFWLGLKKGGRVSLFCTDIALAQAQWPQPPVTLI